MAIHCTLFSWLLPGASSRLSLHRPPTIVCVCAQAELLRKLKAHLDAKTTQAELKRSLDDVRVVSGHLETEKAKQQEDATPTRCGSAVVCLCVCLV